MCRRAWQGARVHFTHSVLPSPPRAMFSVHGPGRRPGATLESESYKEVGLAFWRAPCRRVSPPLCALQVVHRLFPTPDKLMDASEFATNFQICNRCTAHRLQRNRVRVRQRSKAPFPRPHPAFARAPPARQSGRGRVCSRCGAGGRGRGAGLHRRRAHPADLLRVRARAGLRALSVDVVCGAWRADCRRFPAFPAQPKRPLNPAGARRATTPRATPSASVPTATTGAPSTWPTARCGSTENRPRRTQPMRAQSRDPP